MYVYATDTHRICNKPAPMPKVQVNITYSICIQSFRHLTATATKHAASANTASAHTVQKQHFNQHSQPQQLFRQVTHCDTKKTAPTATVLMAPRQPPQLKHKNSSTRIRTHAYCIFTYSNIPITHSNIVHT